MNVALVHDSLTEFGGSERILDLWIRMFPDADIFTAFATRSYRETYLSRVPARNIHTSWIQPLPIEHHTSLIQAIAPAIWGSFRLSSYDLVISHGHHLMANLVSVPRGIHITYVPSPPKNISGMVPPTPLQKIIPYDRYMLPIYKKSLQQSPFVVANSRHTQSILKKRVGVNSDVIYPPVDIPLHSPPKKKGKYFLCVSRIEPNKHLELAVIAATVLGVPLKIVGAANTAWYEQKLKHLAGPTVEFLGFRSDAKIISLYQEAIAFLFPSKNEDFGIAPLEATAHNVPVIAYYGGGAKETILEAETGIFFRHHTANALARAMQEIMTLHFSPIAMRSQAKKFSATRFTEEFSRYVKNAISSTKIVTSGNNG